MAYATESELTTYASDRGITLSGTLSQLLTLAHDYIESKNYQGQRVSDTQSDKWPRTHVFVDGIVIDSETVPQGIKNAEMQAAVEIDQGNDPLGNVDRAVKSEKVDVIEVEYMDNASETVQLKKVNALLRPYLRSGGGFSVVRA